MLVVNNIDVYYGDLQVLWDVSFTVNQNEIVALIGANGAGKSTTLKTISGLLAPKKGNILFDSRDVLLLPPHKIIDLGITHVPEGRRLFPEMKVWENLYMGSLTPQAKKNREQTLEWIFELFPRLAERKNQTAGTLSGGEQQMLAIGRGLMGKPRLIMFDEPSLGLAPILVADIFSIIGRIKEEGVTILIVEQNTQHTLGICDRGYVLENGGVALTGTGEELLNNDYVRQAYLGI
jgi:branched-chain amino acid transport system ATP-binding protein